MANRIEMARKLAVVERTDLNVRGFDFTGKDIPDNRHFCKVTGR
jgi:hypothetical protein